MLPALPWTSPRLILRALHDKDRVAWAGLFTAPETDLFLGIPEGLSALEKVDMWFARNASRQARGHGEMLALERRADGAFLGQSGLLLQEVDQSMEWEIGYSLLPAFRGQGYAIEAARTLRDMAFATGLSDSLISIIHPDNEASKRVARANGMAFDKSAIFRGAPVQVFRIRRKAWTGASLP